MNFPVFALKFVDKDCKSLDGKYQFKVGNGQAGPWHSRKKKALELGSSGFHSILNTGIGQWTRELYTGAERCFLVEIGGRFENDDSQIVSDNIRFIKELPLIPIRHSITLNRDGNLGITDIEDMYKTNITNLSKFINSISKINAPYFIASVGLTMFIDKKPNRKFKSFEDLV
jgi:hypothetical protein